MELVKGNVKVELENIGEGWEGDYDPTDPEDTPLLRFTVYKREAGENWNENWRDVDNGSFCTQIPASTPDAVQARILDHIMSEVYDKVEGDVSIKRLCEGLSWLDGTVEP